jgi:hypothetical protein
MAIMVLSLDELFCPQRELTNWYTGVRFLILFVALVSLTLVSVTLMDSVVSRYFELVDLYSIIFGLIFPFCSQFILSVIRDHRRYALGTVIEICEFGFPFTAFLALFHLCVAYGQRYQSDSDVMSAYSQTNAVSVNATAVASYIDFEYWYHINDTVVKNVIETNSPFLVFYGLTPMFMIPAVVCYVSCALDGCAIDPLLSICLVLCVQHFWTTVAPSALVIASIVFVSLGMVMRVACEYRPTFSEKPLFTLQDDSMQLPHNVIWARSGEKSFPTMRECEMETRELGSASPREHT